MSREHFEDFFETFIEFFTRRFPFRSCTESRNLFHAEPLPKSVRTSGDAPDTQGLRPLPPLPIPSLGELSMAAVGLAVLLDTLVKGEGLERVECVGMNADGDRPLVCRQQMRRPADLLLEVREGWSD